MLLRPILPPTSPWILPRRSRYSLQEYITFRVFLLVLSHATVTRFARTRFSSMPVVENRERFRRERIRSRFCLSRKNATLDKFRNKRKVGCSLLHGDNRPSGDGRLHERKEEKERKSGGCRGWPTEKGWNRGRTINLTIYPLRRGRGVRSEEARE